jgi:limonene-1,2-epoxide hydrolase
VRVNDGYLWGGHMGSTEGERTVERLLQAYERLDVDGMVDCFAMAGEYHAMGMESAVGRDALRSMWSGWAKLMSNVSCEVHRQLANETIVMHERTDRSTVRGKEGTTPVVAVFDIDATGLITDWREYFDDPRTP